MTRKRRRRGKWRIFLAGILLGIICAELIYCGYKKWKAESAEAEDDRESENDSNLSGQTDASSSDGSADTEKQSSDVSDPVEEDTEDTSTVEENKDSESSSDGTEAAGTISSRSGSGPDSREKFSGDISALDNTIQNWGQGVQFDALNRPQGAVNWQEKYGKYSADFIRTEDGDPKKIYLTFDEGYENGYTSQILDVLKEKNCPAVFFVTMSYAKQQPDLIRRMIDEGHIVGNHSVTHPSAGLPSETKERQENELLELHDYVKENFDYEMSLFRYPAGKFSEQSLAIVQNIGYTSVFWSFAHRDWDPDDQPDEASSLAKLTERLHPGAIYLLHAVSKTNTDILGQFIDDARAAGYEFVSYR